MNHQNSPVNPEIIKWIRIFIVLMVLWLVKEFYEVSIIGSKVEMRPITPIQGSLGEDERATIEIFKTVSPSVVFITNKRLRRDFFSLIVTEVPQGAGSGFLWDEKGHIVTNFHVIYNADEIEVKLNNGKIYDASVVGVAPDHDLAVLRIPFRNLDVSPLMIGNSKILEVGQKVLAIGNPFGLDTTLTTGVIGALGRTIQSMTNRYIHDVIQTDAAINPGNSGGPLLDSFGRLIGVNTAIMSPSGSSAGIGFAVPSDTVNRVVMQLINDGKVARPGLGISIIPDRFMAEWKMEGAAILQANRGGAAEKAGLRGIVKLPNGEIEIGDVIVKCDGYPVRKSSDLIKALDRHKVGDEIEIVFLRDGDQIITRVILQELG